ncbi:MAG: restriction endonuclease subunit M [Ruminococcaceae bacterium]|nr:restriction endonuclease subunit M [Oscillospiraceae bacterium]
MAKEENKIIDYISGLEVQGTPEEINAVQPFSKILVEDYNYPKNMVQTHPQVRVKASPSDKKGYPIDIAVYDVDNGGNKYLKMVVENKKPSRKDGIDQLKLYLKFCEATIGIWYNGVESVYIKKIESSGNIHFEEIAAIPKYGQKLSEIGMYKRKDLKGTHNLKEIFSEMRGYIVGNSVGVNRDEVIAKEIIHLILCKIYDERFTRLEDMVSFRASAEDTDEEIKTRIEKLFVSVKKKYKDVLTDSDTIDFDGHTLRFIISKIQQFCLMDTDRDTIADAFEVFIGYSLKGSQGQFFTPKNVVKTLVYAVDPKLEDIIIDPSCGSCGFLVESLKYLWDKLDKEAVDFGWNDAALIEEKKTVGIKNIRGIEKDSFLTKVGKSYMAILGDGKGGIFCEDSLEKPSNWNSFTQQNIKLGGFSVSFSNPPFGKDIKVTGKEKLEQYELARKIDSKGKEKLVDEGNVSTLFLERNMQLLKDGGKLAIILPETYFHAPKQKAVRKYIYQHNIQWIIDLPHNTFRPHNNAKCIAIIIQKNRPQQSKINMAVAEYIGHDHNGMPIYKTNDKGVKTKEILDDTVEIIKEIKNINLNQEFNPKYTFNVDAKEAIRADILVPRYYWSSKLDEIELKAKKENIEMISIKQLIDEGIIKFFDGNGSPASEFKGTGVYPYIRVKDIVNWQVYKDPTALIPMSEFERLYKKEKALKPKDILYVRRGSYRIGSVAMVSPYDIDVILTREILVLRVIKEQNKYNITPEYLLYALSHKHVQEQAENKIFIDTTLPNIADRWKELKIPVYKDADTFNTISDKSKKVVKSQWESAKEINDFRKKYDLHNC